MAQLKDTVVSGNLRVTDATLTDSIQAASGSITSTTFGQFFIKRSDGAYAAGIGFANTNGALGYIGMTSTADGGLLRWKADTSASYTILDTGNHSNPSITAGTAKGDDSKTLTFGGTFTIPSVTYDAHGHITTKGTTTMTMPANPVPSGNVTGSSLTADQIILGNGNSTIKASGKTIATSVTDVDTTVPTSKAVKTFVEGKGYVTTDEKVKQSASTTSNYRSITFGHKDTTTIADLSATVTNQVYTTTNMFGQPSTGTIFAEKFSSLGYASGTKSAASITGSGATSSLDFKTYYTNPTNSTTYNCTGSVVIGYGNKGASNDGRMITIQGGGLTILGSGESATALANIISDDVLADGATKLNVGGDLNTSIVGSDEQLILASDNSIYFIPKCQTIANRNPVVLDTSKNFYPGVNNSGSIGTSSYKWANGYFTNINGVVVGDSPKFTDHITTATTSGSGNAVTAISADANGALTVTKGTTFSTTDENVKNTVGTANTYYPAGSTSTSTATGTQVSDTSLKFIGTTGSTSAVGKAQLVLGNSTASGTAGNKQGSVVVYGSTAYAHTIQGAPTAARTLTLPDKTGTIAVTSDIPTVNNKTLTLKGDGTSVTTFTANASADTSFDVVAGSNVSVTADATNKKITIASSHPTISTSTDTTSTASPAHGGTFTTVDSVTRDSNGHVTKINTKTVTLPASGNTDTKVNVTLATTTKSYLLGTSTTPTSTAQAVTSLADTGVYLTTNAGELYATTLKTTTPDVTDNSTTGATTEYVINKKHQSGIFYASASDFANAPWGKIAEYTIATASATRWYTFRLYEGYEATSISSGLLLIRVATNASKNYSTGNVVWLHVTKNINTDNVVVTYTNTTDTNTIIQIWVKGTVRYQSWQISPIYGGYASNSGELGYNFFKISTGEAAYTGTKISPTIGSIQNPLYLIGDASRITQHTADGIRFFAPTGNWATGLSWYKSDGSTLLTRVGAYGTADALTHLYIGSSYSTPTVRVVTTDSTASTPATRSILGVYGATYGNTAATMISGTAGLFSYGDGGPQIDFSTSVVGSQSGALIFTDHDTAAAGASWHFVSNQTDWNVTSKRFHARTSISIGTNLPTTGYNLYVKGTTRNEGNLTLYSASGDSPALIFQRGTLIDSLNDWKIYVKGGGLYFAQSTANASSETWTDKMYLHPSDGNLYVGSTKVSLDGHTHLYAGSSSAGGPANSAVKAYHTKTNPDSDSLYGVSFHASANTSENKDLFTNDGIRYKTIEGTTSSNGYGYLVLGNGVASGTAGNKYGGVRIYSTGTGYVQLHSSDEKALYFHSGADTEGDNFSPYRNNKFDLGTSSKIWRQAHINEVYAYAGNGRCARYYASGIQFTMPSAGWVQGLTYYATDGTTSIGSIAGYGNANGLNYFYIGGQYTDPHLKVGADGKVTAKNAINHIITGTGTTAQDKGSGVSPRYFPAKWKFDTGLTPSNGDVIVIKAPCAGSDYGVWISIDNGDNYYPISVNGTSRLTTHYGSGYAIALIYKNDGSTASIYGVNGSDTRATYSGPNGDPNSNGAWIVLNYYDSGNTYDRNRYNAAIKAWGTKIISGNIIVGTGGLYHHLKQGTAFDISYPILYLAGDCNASSTTSNTYDQINFTVTTTQSITLTAYKPVYIKGTLSGTTFTPVSTTPLTQTVPTTQDGYHYMLLGNATSTTAIFLLDDHRIFAYRNGSFSVVSNPLTIAPAVLYSSHPATNDAVLDFRNSIKGYDLYKLFIVDVSGIGLSTGVYLDFQVVVPVEYIRNTSHSMYPACIFTGTANTAECQLSYVSATQVNFKISTSGSIINDWTDVLVTITGCC